MIKSSSARWVVAILAVLICGSLLLADNKPWKSKPFQNWDASDVQRIMTDSPWVQITTIDRSWLPVSEKDVPPEQEIAGGVRGMPNPAASNRASEASDRQLKVYVYWDSAHVMRAATAQNAALHGMLKDSDIEQYANAPQEEYQVVLYMADMTPFLKNDGRFFQDKAYIQTKRGKLKLQPSHVKYDHGSNGQLKDVIFFFPKKTSSGAPTITPDETEVGFHCNLDGARVGVNFSIPKMVGPTGVDL